MVEQEPPRGGLYELEQTTWYHVVDAAGAIVMTFSGQVLASLSRDTGLWDDYTASGACRVTVAADQRSVIVLYSNGREEAVPLP